MSFKLSGTSIRIVACIFVLLLVLTIFLTNYFEDMSRIKELYSKYAYEVYFTYIENRQTYRLYFMCNPDYTLTDIIENTFTTEYLGLLQTNIAAANTPPAQTTVFLMTPTEEIPYGWEKSNLNISCNFDLSTFHNNTICKIYIPYGASVIDSCTIEYQ